MTMQITSSECICIAAQIETNEMTDTSDVSVFGDVYRKQASVKRECNGSAVAATNRSKNEQTPMSYSHSASAFGV